jgi:hypothetical protein
VHPGKVVAEQQRFFIPTERSGVVGPGICPSLDLGCGP